MSQRRAHGKTLGQVAYENSAHLLVRHGPWLGAQQRIRDEADEFAAAVEKEVLLRLQEEAVKKQKP